MTPEERLAKRKEYDALNAMKDMMNSDIPKTANNPITMHTDRTSTWGAAEEEEKRKKKMKDIFGGN